MEAKHTPGPWELLGVGGEVIKLAPYHGGYEILAVAREGDRVFGAVLKEEDARLIAAAPELLEACEKAFERLLFLESRFDNEDSLEYLKSAIAKAKGEA